MKRNSMGVQSQTNLWYSFYALSRCKPDATLNMEFLFNGNYT